MSDRSPQAGNQGIGSVLIIDWLDAFHGRTRLEKQEAIAECYSERIRTAGQTLNLIGLHNLEPKAGEDAWQSFVSTLQEQAEYEDRAVALQFATRPRKKTADAGKLVDPTSTPEKALEQPVEVAAALYDAFKSSLARHRQAQSC
jgi:hypothetical protein